MKEKIILNGSFVLFDTGNMNSQNRYYGSIDYVYGDIHITRKKTIKKILEHVNEKV